MFDLALQENKAPKPSPLAASRAVAAAPGKPAFRGIPDVVATLVALPAVAYLLLHARAGILTTAGLVYGLCLIGLFTVSACYHTFMWPVRVRAVWRRIDHSMVYMLIAGTYTPVCLGALEPGLGRPFLAVVWVVAVLGFLKSFFWETSPRWLNTSIYLVMGWMLLPIVPALYRGIGPSNFALLGLGGVIYSVGAVVYARRWPNPDPKIFGYHEVFHVFVVVAAACHYAIVWNILT